MNDAIRVLDDAQLDLVAGGDGANFPGQKQIGSVVSQPKPEPSKDPGPLMIAVVLAILF